MFTFKEHPWLLVEPGIAFEPVKTRAAQYNASLLQRITLIYS